MKGVLSLIRWKSARSKGQPAALDMANRCKTALVLPPRAITVVMPFSKAFGVMMSSGLMSRFNSSSNALQHRLKRWVVRQCKLPSTVCWCAYNAQASQAKKLSRGLMSSGLMSRFNSSSNALQHKSKRPVHHRLERSVMRWDFKLELCLAPAEGMTVVRPFSMAFGAMMSSGLMSRFSSSSNALQHSFKRSVQVQTIGATHVQMISDEMKLQH